MQLIAPPTPTSSGRWIVTPKASVRFQVRRQRAMARRKLIFEALTGACAGTFVLAVFKGGQLWQLNLLADAAVFSYAVVLVGVKRRTEEKALKIHPLPATRRAEAESYSLSEPAQAGGGR